MKTISVEILYYNFKKGITEMALHRFLGIVLVCILILPNSSGADTTIVFQEAKNGDAKTAIQSIYVRGGTVRVENAFEKGNFIIFKSETNSMTVVDVRDKRYITIDRTLLAERSGPLSPSQRDAMNTANEKIGSLPPEKQDQLRSIMEYVMQYSTPTGKKSEKIRYIPLQEERVVNGSTCRVTETHRGKTKVSEICMVNRDVLNIPREDYDSLQNLQAFISEMNSSTVGKTFDHYNLHIGYAEFEQFPVLVTRYLDNGLTRTLIVVRVNAEPIPHDIFSVPAGYKQMKAFF
jgi:helix-turn-helix protein